jgi:hypothetical protein
MHHGLEALLTSQRAYADASDAARRFIEQRFDEASVLAPYLDAIVGANKPSRQAA